MLTKRLALLGIILTLGLYVNAQNLRVPQPPGNYGLTSVLDGAPPGPGFYIMEYLSYYSGTVQDPDGNDMEIPVDQTNMGTIDISAGLLLNQAVWIGETKILGGNVLLDLLVPIVILDTKDPVDMVGKNGLGDIIVGAGLQWFDKKLFGLPYFHRIEFDFILPLGAHDLNEGPINAGSKFMTFQPYYAQTLMFNPNLSVSLRHHLSFHGKYEEISGVEMQAGNFYHVNYSLEHIIGKSRFKPGESGEMRLAAQGYWGTQFTDNKVNDEDVPDSRESVFAVGPAVHYVTKKGLALAAKVAFEVDATNRPQGVRSTLRLIKYFP